jgi:hypothetical protein
MGWNRGFQAIKDANQEQQSGFGPRLGYLNWKDGDKYIIRFLTEEMIVAQFAEWVITNNEKIPATDFMINPDTENFVAKYGGLSKEYGTGNLVPPKLAKRGVSVVVLRKEVPDGKGRTQVVDLEEGITIDGKVFKARKFAVLKQSLGNFWQHFEGQWDRYGTVCDRDFEVVRRGKDKDTKYSVVGIDAPADDPFKDLAYLQEYYGYGRKYNENDPERYLYCPQTLEEWAAEHSSEDRAKRLLQGAQARSAATVTPNGFPTVTTPLYETRIADDEAQAVPSSGSQFTDFRDSFKDRILPHLNNQG